MIRRLVGLALFIGLGTFSGCGYHTVGAATHLPPDARTLSVPMFATRTETYHTETALTDAVIREFVARSRMRVTPAGGDNPDVVLVLVKHLAIAVRQRNGDNQRYQVA